MSNDFGAASAPGLVLLPLTGAALSFLLGGRAAPALPLFVAVLTAFTAGLVAAAVADDGVLQFPIGGWSAPLGIEWMVDGLAATMIAITAVTSVGVAAFSAVYLSAEDRESEWFWPIFLFLWSALNALYMTRDAFNAYVALELVSLAAVGLVTLEGRAAPLAAGMRYLLLALVGSLAYLLAIALLYAGFGTLDLSLLGERVKAGFATSLALAFAIVGLFVKAALFPLHSWLPPAHAAAPAPASALLSALVVKAGFYLLLRLWLEVFSAAGSFAAVRSLIGACGAAAVLWGSLLALRQTRLKSLLAYSTVAQLGYLLLLFPLIGSAVAWDGAVIHVAAHALAKAAMFLAAGLIVLALGHDRLAGIHGAAQAVPMTVFAFAIAALSLVGLPPSGGFIAKWLLLVAAFEEGRWWWGLVPIAGGILAAAYVFRVVAPAFIHDGKAVTWNAVPRRAELAALALAIGSLLLGLFGWQGVSALSWSTLDRLPP